MATNEIRCVLVPIDLSEASRAAATRAAWIAHQLGASLHFVHAADGHEEPIEYDDEGAVATAWQGSDESAKHELARKELSALAAKLEFAGPKITCDVVAGRPLAVVREAIQRGRGDLVVLGVHPHHSLWHLVAESTSDRAIRVLPVPVLAVKEAESDAARPLRQLLVMTDFSPCSESALGFAIRLAKGFGARLDVLHALALQAPTFFPYDSAPSGDWIERTRAAGSQKLRASIERVRAEGIEGDSHLVDEGPIKAIFEHPMEGVDLIVVGTHGHTGVKRMVLGSVAERALHNAPCSITVVH